MHVQRRGWVAGQEVVRVGCWQCTVQGHPLVAIGVCLHMCVDRMHNQKSKLWHGVRQLQGLEAALSSQQQSRTLELISQIQMHRPDRWPHSPLEHSRAIMSFYVPKAGRRLLLVFTPHPAKPTLCSCGSAPGASQSVIIPNPSHLMS